MRIYDCVLSDWINEFGENVVVVVVVPVVVVGSVFHIKVPLLLTLIYWFGIPKPSIPIKSVIIYDWNKI